MLTNKFLSLALPPVPKEQSLWIKKQLETIYGQEDPKYYERDNTTEADFQISLKQMVALLDFIVQAKPKYTLFSTYKERVVALPESPSVPDRLATLTMTKKNLEEGLWVICHIPKDPLVINDYTVDQCYQGAASNIAMALTRFRVQGFESALIASKEKMLRNLALSFINEHQISPAPGNEIHYVNAFINLIAPKYGLQEVVDSFAPQSIPPEKIEEFHTYLEYKLTISSFLSSLHTELPVSLPKAPFNANDLSSFKLLEDYAEFITKDTHVHCQITNLYDFSEDEDRMRPVQHFDSYLDAILVSFLERLDYVKNQHLSLGDNKFIFNGTSFIKIKDDELALLDAEEQQQIQEKLRCCLLGTHKLPDSFAISENALIDLLDEATLWALFTANEATDDLKNRSIIRLLQTNCPLIIREPLRAWLQHTAPNKNGFLFLLNSRYYNVIQSLAEQNLITTEILRISPLRGLDQGINTLWLLVAHEQFDVLRLLIEQNLISTELLAACPLQGPDQGINALWLLVAQEQFDVLRLLIEQKLISTELLAACPLQGTDQGINALWGLIEQNEFNVLRLLIEQKLISTELLAASPLQGFNQGINTLWMLIAQKQYDVLRLLIEQNLISTELLAATPLHGPNQGINALWILVKQNQFDVLRLLIEQNLISTELLAATPLQGLSQGINALWILAEQNQIDVLRLLIEKNLISTELLAATPLQDPNQGINALWILVDQKQFDVLSLLIEKNLISTELLAATPLQGPCQGLNALWILAEQKQFDVLRLLIEKNLISTELLAATPLQGPSQGLNTLWILIAQKQYDVLRPLIEQNLISMEPLAACPLQGPNQGLNALWILVEQNQFDVVRLLIEQNLISTELLAATPLQGSNQGVNALWRLIEQNQVDVLHLLIERNLITTELLKATCPQEPNRRKNALRILIEDHQQYALVSRLLARDLVNMEQISIILCDMVQAQEWKKIERMVQANIITQESLRYTPPAINSKKVKSMPLLWMIAFEKANPQENKSLWEYMVEKNLVTREDLSVSSNKGQSKGKNIVWLLANHGRRDILSLLLNNKLITQEQLEKKPEIKSKEKKNAEQPQQACQKTLKERNKGNNLENKFFSKFEPGLRKRAKGPGEQKNSQQDDHQSSNAMNHSPN